jgi:hypothetical protein
MREIKFRGKGINSGQWFYGSAVTFGNKAYIFKMFRLLRMEHAEVVPDTVGQFTGLHDRYGYEIYEGDIVRHDENGKCYSIIYEEPMFRFAPNDDCFAFLNHPELLEVIGNIHDNPELLKGGEQ